MISIKADNAADDIHAIALVSTARSELTPALVAILNSYPLATRTAVRTLAAAITAGVAST
jgi:hypothetical protein